MGAVQHKSHLKLRAGPIEVSNSDSYLPRISAGPSCGWFGTDLLHLIRAHSWEVSWCLLDISSDSSSPLLLEMVTGMILEGLELGSGYGTRNGIQVNGILQTCNTPKLDTLLGGHLRRSANSLIPKSARSAMESPPTLENISFSPGLDREDDRAQQKLLY